jgi:uncharacterized Zn finger protein
MSKKKMPLDRFAGLTWDNLDKWAGSRIVSRGKNYQRQGHVSELAATEDGVLIAWVQGSERYATRVKMEDDGLPDSICTCPYEFDCKHGVAVVLEYLERIEGGERVPKAHKDDERLRLFEDEGWEDEADEDEPAMPQDIKGEIDSFLKGKTKGQLIKIILELADRYPDIGQDLADRRQIVSGDVKAMVTRLRRDIREIGEEPGWQNYWRGEGYTPDYSNIRTKLETLLKAGHADEVLTLGEELISTGVRQVEESHDEGETAMEISECMPVIVQALDRSSLEPSDKLAWAVDAVLKDEFDLCKPMAEYLMRRHKKEDWSLLADRLLGRLKTFKSSGEEDAFGGRYRRDCLSDWTIHALERAGRTGDIIPLCEVEAKKTGSYDRLVTQLLAHKRYEDAEGWIQEGIREVGQQWPGIASNLRGKLREIRGRQGNWLAVAALQVEEFVRHASQETYKGCKKASEKVKVWLKVRQALLAYLESGVLPWEQQDWPLPETGLGQPDVHHPKQFPMIDELIDIAIFEKKPDQVLRWYDQRPQRRFGWYSLDEDRIASAIKTHAPDRAAAIWKALAEGLIAQVKPRAYQEAAKYLRKAGQVMAGQEKQKEWDQYLQDLRERHFRKRRFIEIMEGLDGKPIVRKRR